MLSINTQKINTCQEFSEFVAFNVLNIWNQSRPQHTWVKNFRWMQQRIYNIMIITKAPLPMLLLAVYYVERIYNSLKNAYAGAEYRVFATALILSQKYLDDNRYTNKTWSKILGIPLLEINEMEVEFLKQIKYNVFVRADDYKEWLLKTQHLAANHQKVAVQPFSNPLSPSIQSPAF